MCIPELRWGHYARGCWRIFHSNDVIRRFFVLRWHAPGRSLASQRMASYDRVEFRDQPPAPLRPPATAADFKCETSHRTEIGGGIALAHVIEQGGANIVDRMDVDPGLSVGQTIDASARRGVGSYRKRCKGVSIMTCKRHLLPSDSELAPGRLRLYFGRHYGPPAWRFPGTGAFRHGKRFGVGVGADISGGQFVIALPASSQVGSQLVAAKDRTLLNADPVVAEDYHVGGDRDFLQRPSASLNAEPIDAGIFPLIKAEIPDFHEIPFRAIEDRLKPPPLELRWGRLPRCFSVTEMASSDPLVTPPPSELTP